MESVSAPKPGADNSEEQRFKTKEGEIVPTQKSSHALSTGPSFLR